MAKVIAMMRKNSAVLPLAIAFAILTIWQPLADDSLTSKASYRSDHIQLSLPDLSQLGETSNCGPTAAAIVMAGYHEYYDETSLLELRDLIGKWTWENDPARRWYLPGTDAGMTSPDTMKASIERFAPSLKLAMRRLPLDTRATDVWHKLTRDLRANKPTLALVMSSKLWQLDSISLHWVVIVGVRDNTVIFSDPADGKVMEMSAMRFFDAWRMPLALRLLLGAYPHLTPKQGMARPLIASL